MPELFLVRHGQASFGAKNYDKLSPLGHQQSLWLGQYFNERQCHFSQVFTGTLVRHQETAAGILQGLDEAPEPKSDARFNEFDFATIGQAYLNLYPAETLAPSASPSEFYRLLKKAMLAWSQNQLNPDDVSESWQDFKTRTSGAIECIKSHQAEGPVLAVSSGGAIAMMMSVILGLDAVQVIELNMQIRNTSFSHLYFNQHNIRLSSFNNVPHLDTLERLPSITFS
ncbi:MAG: histidine phosphatase family protein [Paraglaciecola sp.]|uniref:histidine phosphatase family protein n=1 Tax=Paraglaciecola sp. TaxID=1920173 RepID=UPI00273D0F6A|nr:histidine phosphatase family protein [Paraglaciecola sp.]MDP5031861.1 histidine phosphatase family protein [Paraglaciecola sp.]MDP5134160.1 histidine phosphatase family protein [Paraglaciecola sp.]